MVKLLSNWFANRIPANFKGEVPYALLRTFIARGVAALGSLILILVIGRLYGAAGVGVYALGQSIILGSGIIARYGTNNAIMRFVGQDHYSPNVMVYLYWGCKKAILLSIAAAIIIFFSRYYLESFFDAEGLAGVLVGIAVATPAFTLGFLFSGFFKGIRKPATACLLENGSVALVTGGLVLLLSFLPGAEGLKSIGWAYALASWLILIQGGWQIKSWWCGQKFHEVEASMEKIITRQQFSRSSQAFFVMGLAGFMQRVVGVAIAGWLLSSEELGLFKVSQEIALIIAFVLIVINAVYPPRFASLYHQKKIDMLARLARQGVIIGVVFAAPPLLICLLFPEWVLGFLGDEFLPASPLLRLIALAQLINVASGSVDFLLNMTGYEALMRNISLICNVIGLLLFFILIPAFGPMGAAMALAFVLIVQNVVALYFVWRKLGIWMLPIPNILDGLGIKNEAVETSGSHEETP